MAMAAKENMEIVVCPSSDTKQYRDFDCEKYVQTDCEHPEHSGNDDDDMKRFSTDSYAQQASCSDCNKDDPVVAFCHTCKSSLCTFCYDCHIRQNQYKEHNVVNFEQKVTEQGNRLSRIYAGCVDASQLVPLYIIEMEEQLSKRHSELNQIGRKLAMEAEKANDKIDQLYTEQIYNLKQQKEQKIEQLHDKALESENMNLAKLKDVESIQKQLESFKKSLNITSLAQVTTVEINERYRTIMAQPVLAPSLEFRISDTQTVSLGDVICTNSACNAVKEDKQGTNNVRHEFGSARSRSNSVLKLLNIIKRNKSDASIKKPSNRDIKDASTYHIKHIQWPTRIKTNGGKMGYMFGIEFSNTGTGIWAVADYSNHCVHVCDANNELIKIFGNKGKGNNQFNHPVGITFDSKGCLYVSEYVNHRVQKFDAKFNYMLHFGDEGEDDGQLNHPMGITAYKDKVYVADSANSRIAVFYTNGEFYRNIVSGCLRDPYDVSINETNKQLLVIDYAPACCIRIYSLEGEYINRFSGCGADRGLLNHPASLAIVQGFVFVADTYNHRICVFDNTGMFVHSFGSYGNKEGQFNRPQGIAFSNNGTLYISDYGNQRVMIFPTKLNKK